MVEPSGLASKRQLTYFRLCWSSITVLLRVCDDWKSEGGVFRKSIGPRLLIDIALPRQLNRWATKSSSQHGGEDHVNKRYGISF